MHIDKAIKILKNWKEPGSVFDVGELVKAKQLGIEALKQVKYLHEIHILHEHELLPGETDT